MKRIVLIAAVLCCNQAWAQEQPALTPLQQYLYGESGYAPVVGAQPVPVQQEPSPQVYYEYTPEQYAAAAPASGEEIEYATEGEDHLNDGVRGLTW